MCKVEDPNDIKSVSVSTFGDSEIKKEKSAPATFEEKESAEKSTLSRISPSAKLLITEFGLDASSIKASGPRGTLLKGDVLAVIKSGGTLSKASDLLPKILPVTSQSSKVDTQPSPPRPSEHSQHTDTYEDLPNSQIRKVRLPYI